MNKWFYPLQAKAEEMIDKRYERIGYTLYQVVSEDIVFEGLFVRRKEDESTVQIVVATHRSNLINIFELVQFGTIK